MRTKNSFINIIIGMGGQSLGIVLSFLSRVIFVHFLSAEYLGLNGLFSNILGVLSLAELGIGSAMIYSLYKPLAEKKQDELGSLMSLYRILYRCVAIVVLVLGLALFPFLDYLIKGKPDIVNLKLIYLMYLANSVCSYLYSYKYSIFLADQKAYVRVVYEQILHITQIIIQIGILLFTGNYIFYLSIQLMSSLSLNILIARRADKEYPFLKKKYDLPTKDQKKHISKNIIAMSMHKFGGVLVNGTDNLLMSAFVGLGSVGIYSNYKLVIANINILLGKVYDSFVASVGNLGVTECREKVYEIFRALDFFMFWIYSYIAVGLLVLFNPFIELVFGKEYLFSMAVVLLIVINFYMTGMRQANLLFREAMGLFWYDRYKPIAEVLINLIVSIVLVRKYEICGILVGTIASCIFTCLWIEPYILMKYGIKEQWKQRFGLYFINYGIRSISGILGGWIVYQICIYVPVTGFGGMIVKGCILTVVYNIWIFVLFGKSKEFQILKKKGQELLCMRLKKSGTT